MADRSQSVHPFDHDPITGATETFVYNHEDDSFTIIHEVDVEPILKQAALMRSCFDENSPWPGSMHQVALIPEHIKQQLMQTGQWFDENEMKDWLNDPENFKWRTRPGKV